MNALSNTETALNLLASLAVGVVIGIERGWTQRQQDDGQRVAGLRTFSLVGLLGGILALFSDLLLGWLLLSTVLGLTALLAVAWHEAARTLGDLSITTAVALILTLMLGVAAMHGHVAIALAAAVVAAVLLDMKSTLHRWLRLIEHRELAAALQVLVLSVVILPSLPDTGFGPYRALNPHQLWWAVVLIAGLSLAGHFAMRITGLERGLLLTGVLGGLASSTAATLSLARVSKAQPALAAVASAGALAACGVMYLRIFILLLAIEPALLSTFGLALPLTGSALLLMGIWTWRRAGKRTQSDGVATVLAPFDLSSALVFGALLGAMAVVVPAAKDWLGATGVYSASAFSGLLDVDAIVISLARTHRTGDIAAAVTVVALCVAVLANMASKALMAWVAGDRRFGLAVSRGYLIALLTGAVPMMLIIFERS